MSALSGLHIFPSLEPVEGQFYSVWIGFWSLVSRVTIMKTTFESDKRTTLSSETKKWLSGTLIRVPLPQPPLPFLLWLHLQACYGFPLDRVPLWLQVWFTLRKRQRIQQQVLQTAQLLSRLIQRKEQRQLYLLLSNVSTAGFGFVTSFLRLWSLTGWVIFFIPPPSPMHHIFQTLRAQHGLNHQSYQQSWTRWELWHAHNPIYPWPAMPCSPPSPSS